MPGDPVPFVLLGNGRVAARAIETWGARVAAPELVVLNERPRQREADAIRRAAAAAGVVVMEWSGDAREAVLQRAHALPTLWLVSVYFGHLVGDRLIRAVEGRAINLHPALLPWCRGTHTNVWPIVEHSPAGVTLHVMVSELDRGPILVQEEVVVGPGDTAASLYDRLEEAALRLLLSSWPDSVLARWPGRLQPSGGSGHSLADFARLGRVTLDGRPDARALYDLMRARSFPPHPGLQVEIEGRVVEVTLSIREIEAP